MVLPPPYQRPPGAEIPAMGFAEVLKILVKASLLSSFNKTGDIAAARSCPDTDRDFLSQPYSPALCLRILRGGILSLMDQLIICDMVLFADSNGGQDFRR
jgi:hypothetical protein